MLKFVRAGDASSSILIAFGDVEAEYPGICFRWQGCTFPRGRSAYRTASHDSCRSRTIHIYIVGYVQTNRAFRLFEKIGLTYHIGLMWILYIAFFHNGTELMPWRPAGI